MGDMGHMNNGHWWGMGFGHGIGMFLFWGVVILLVAGLIKYLFGSK